jgi:hypothetical protein
VRTYRSGFVHVARFDRLLGYTCTQCRAQMDMVVAYDMDHYDDCPGYIERAEGTLGGANARTDDTNRQSRA